MLFRIIEQKGKLNMWKVTSHYPIEAEYYDYEIEDILRWVVEYEITHFTVRYLPQDEED